MLVCLLVVAILTPFEASFLHPAVNTVFALNRVLDVAFLAVRARAPPRPCSCSCPCPLRLCFLCLPRT